MVSPSPPADESDPYLNVKAPVYLRTSKIVAYALNAWVTIGVIVLILRVFLLAFSANQSTPFVGFIYRTSGDYLAPFRGIFPPKSLGESGYLDVAALFAIVVYLILAWAIGALVACVQSKIDTNTYEQRQAIWRAEVRASELRASEQGTTETF